MKRFIEGEGRSQAILFPEYLDDWIAEDNRSGLSKSSSTNWT